MNVEKLKQYQYILGEINDIDTEISALKEKNTMDVVKGSLEEFPYTPCSVKVCGHNESDVKSLAKMQKRKSELVQMKDEIENFIDNISDIQVKRILRYKYIKGKTWAEVADFMGGQNTRDSVRMMSKRFLENL